ncbi:YceH family protein [Pedobacter sp. UYEF25]
MDNQTKIPQLTTEQQRVLGVLIEKSRTTPEVYPMSLNSLTLGCNQKSARNPVVNYDDDLVITTLNQLKIMGLISTATGGSSRVTKYKHNLGIVFPLVPADLSILCLLFLRGPLTSGEINSNSGRLFEFESIEEVTEHLENLAEGEHPFVKKLQKRPGQKEGRYIHLLRDPNLEIEEIPLEKEEQKPANNIDLEPRVAALELELAELKEMVNLLMNG